VAVRPIFIPAPDKSRLVEERDIDFNWHKGMAPSQKKKNVIELHKSAAQRGLSPLLEVSTKSEELLGQRLSAFNLKVELDSGITIPLESAFQGSKVFEHSGPFHDLYSVDGRSAKRDERLTSSGKLVGFNFEGLEVGLEPKTAFYDWLYIRSIYPHRDFLQRLHKYKGFTDIEFNPEKSINCQARSCATFVALDTLDLLSDAMRSINRFIELLRPGALSQPHSYADRQSALF
jgi:hypothetical protein